MSARWVTEQAEEVKRIIAQYPQSKSAIMPLLHLAQQARGYVAREDMAAIAEILSLTESYVESVCSFYSLYFREPVGKYVIHVCNNLSCGMRGAEQVVAHLEERLGIKAGETTPDGMCTLLVTGECVAACDGAPAMQINLEYCLNLTPEKLDAIVAAMRKGLNPAEIADTIGLPAPAQAS